MQTPSLLITDDDADFRSTLCEVFAPRGFRTLTASDGEQALRIVSRESVHLVLLDMHMPRLDGLETARRVKQMRLSLPCILISAQLNEELIEEARRADVFSSLAKPVQLRDVLAVVHRAMRVTYGWGV